MACDSSWIQCHCPFSLSLSLKNGWNELKAMTRHRVAAGSCNFDSMCKYSYKVACFNRLRPRHLSREELKKFLGWLNSFQQPEVPGEWYHTTQDKAWYWYLDLHSGTQKFNGCWFQNQRYFLHIISARQKAGKLISTENWQTSVVWHWGTLWRMCLRVVERALALLSLSKLSSKF